MGKRSLFSRARRVIAGAAGLSLVVALAATGLSVTSAGASGPTVVTPGPAKYAKAAKTFYCGKTITLYIPFAPGGGTDTYGRAFASEVTQFIPCHPTIVVKNLTGAGGLTAMQEVTGVLPADGLTAVVMNSAIALITLVGSQSGSDFGLKSMDPIFTVASPTVIFTRTAVASTPAELMAYAQTHLINMSFTSPGSTGQAFDYLTLMLLGISPSRFKAVDGFTGLGAPVALAMQQGSIDLSTDPPAGYQQSFLPLQQQGIITPLFQVGTLNAAGQTVPLPGWHPGGAKIPTIESVYRGLHHGKAPGGLLWQTMKTLISVLSVGTGEVFLTRGGTPPAALYALREGFDKLIQSKSGMAAIATSVGASQNGLVFNYQQAEQYIKAMYKTPTTIVHELGCVSGVYNPACLNGQ